MFDTELPVEMLLYLQLSRCLLECLLGLPLDLPVKKLFLRLICMLLIFECFMNAPMMNSLSSEGLMLEARLVPFLVL